MSTVTTIARAIVTVIGAGALLVSLGNMLTGGGQITDPVMPGGVIFGLAVLGAAAWTTAPGRLQAAVVWFGVLAIAVAATVIWSNVGEMQTRDLVVYVGIPTVIVLAATAVIALARARSGALGTADVPEG